MTFPNITVPFLGIISVPIKTYTSSYTGLTNPWGFDNQNIEPIELRTYINGSSNWKGSKGNVLTRSNITPFNIGDTTSGGTTNGACAWIKNQLFVMGSIHGTAGPSEPNAAVFPFPRDGVGLTQPTLIPTILKVLPNLSNTGCPANSVGWGGEAAGVTTHGIRYSYLISLASYNGVWDGINNYDYFPIKSTLDGSTHATTSVLPGFGAKNRILIGHNGSGLLDNMWANQSFSEATVAYSATFVEPPTSDFVFNTYIHTNRDNSRVCKYGWLLIDRSTKTVNGVTLVGCGVLILPNLQGYYLLQITGTDTLSNAWASNLGTTSGAIGVDGDLFMKSSNNQSVLFISGAPVILPQYNATFAALSDPTFTDWKSLDGVGANYTSYFESKQSLDEPDLKTNAPYIYTFMQNGGSPTSSGATIKIMWDWTRTTDTIRVTPPDQVYRYVADQLLSVRKSRVRGKGRDLHVRYDSTDQKDFDIKGWVVFYETNAQQ